jgi:putative addiction module component (TIGR02574 family)
VNDAASSLYDRGKLTLEQTASITGFTPETFLVMMDESESLNESINDYSIHEEIEQAWEIEIQKRLADVKSGRTKLIPGDEMFNHVRKL